MLIDLPALETKVQQLVELYARVRDENRSLRTRLVTLEGENKGLNEKVAAARDKLEGLLAKLPAE